MASKVAKKEESALAIPMEDLLADAGAGGEEVRSDDVQIPTLVIIQKMSPQLDKQHAAYVEGAEAGDIVNTLTGDYYEGEAGIEVIPCHFRPQVNHVQPTSSGADYIATYGIGDKEAQEPTIRSEDGRWDLLRDGSALQKVALHFVLTAGDCQPAVIRMKRSNMHPSKRLNALLAGFEPLEGPNGQVSRPRFSIKVGLQTARQETDGNVFWIWNPRILGAANAGQYYAGKALHEMVVSGVARAAPEEDDGKKGTVPF